MPTTVPKGVQASGKKSDKAMPSHAVDQKQGASTGVVQSFDLSALIEVPEEYKQQLRQAFDLFDDAGKGFIPSHEAVVALYALGYDVSRAELQQLLQEIGAPGADLIDFNEFYSVLTLKMTKKENRTDSVRAFKQIDAEDKGYVDVENLRSIANSLHMELTDDELAEMIQFARSVGFHTVAQGHSEFDAKDTLAVTEADYLRLMKRANLF
ncbi:putative centrin [Leptomonas pyrrhocoris]|uniref:Putative centrin n=1 Tax=Leptomonas pyrrhocoris TaxID=157538 RepID=A0A0M9G8E4_LEPPY|nr:putative centrin [Leptomonas pyrrhocoris]KPA84569.1 putative centrin [Leptomonas pyrrhocoris]|eukprot:XP_015663008.1 putative centrin [Leptomonas pyrrhocoris]